MINKDAIIDTYTDLTQFYRRVRQVRRAIGYVAERQYYAFPTLRPRVRDGEKVSVEVFDPGTKIETAQGTIYPDILAIEGGIYVGGNPHTGVRTIDSRRVTLFYRTSGPEPDHIAEIRPSGSYSLDGRREVVGNVGLPLPFMRESKRNERITHIAQKAIQGLFAADAINRSGNEAMVQRFRRG